jgi:hypothetical protein
MRTNSPYVAPEMRGTTKLKEAARQQAADAMRYASRHSARQMLVAIADDFQNDYLRIGRYAELNGLSLAHAESLIELAQAIRKSDHPEA